MLIPGWFGFRNLRLCELSWILLIDVAVYMHARGPVSARVSNFEISTSGWDSGHGPRLPFSNTPSLFLFCNFSAVRRVIV